MSLGSDWSKDAACRDMSDLFGPLNAQQRTDIFYCDTDDRRSVSIAKAICSTCTVKFPCLTWAIGNNESEGIWGGMTPKERRERQKRRQ